MLKLTTSVATLNDSTCAMCFERVYFAATHPTKHCMAGITNLSIVGNDFFQQAFLLKAATNVYVSRQGAAICVNICAFFMLLTCHIECSLLSDHFAS